MADVINIVQEPVSSTSPTIKIVQPFIVNAFGYLTKEYADTLYEPILTGAKLAAVTSGITLAKVTSYDTHLIDTNNPHSVTKSQIGLGNVENYGQSAVPIEGSNLYFTAGGAYTEFAKKQNVIDTSHKLSADLVDDTSTTNKFVTARDKTNISHIDSIEGAVYGSLGNKIVLEIDPSTYVLTASLKNIQNQTIALSSSSIDLPLESMVVSGEYDNSTKSIILTLQSGQTMSIPVADLVSGLQSEITSDNKLSADLIEDGTTNKVFTATEQTKLSGIESGAEVNTIESVSINGTALIPDANKDVNIPVAGNAILGVVALKTDGTNGIVLDLLNRLKLQEASSADIAVRTANTAITPANLNEAIVAALSDANRLIMSSSEIATAQATLGIKNEAGTVTIASTDWSSNVATKTFNSLGSNDLIAFIPATTTDRNLINACDIWPTVSGTTVTFTALNGAPTSNITVSYFITRGQAV